MHFLMLPVKVDLIKNVHKKLPQFVVQVLFIQGWDDEQHPQGSAQWNNWNEARKPEHCQNSKTSHQTHLKQKLIALGIALKIPLIQRGKNKKTPCQAVKWWQASLESGGLLLYGSQTCLLTLPLPAQEILIPYWVGKLSCRIFVQCCKEGSVSFSNLRNTPNRLVPWLVFGLRLQHAKSCLPTQASCATSDHVPARLLHCFPYKATMNTIFSHMKMPDVLYLYPLALPQFIPQATSSHLAYRMSWWLSYFSYKEYVSHLKKCRCKCMQDLRIFA